MNMEAIEVSQKTVTLEALTKKVVHFDWQKADINMLPNYL